MTSSSRYACWRHTYTRQAAGGAAARRRAHPDDDAPRTYYHLSSLAGVELGLQSVSSDLWVRCDKMPASDGVLTAEYDRIHALSRASALVPATGQLDPWKARILLHALLGQDVVRRQTAAVFAAASGLGDPHAWPWTYDSDPDHANSAEGAVLYA